MKTIVLQLVAAVLIAAVSIALYHRYVDVPSQRVAYVDIAAVYNEKEAEFRRLVAASPAAKSEDHALDAARDFAKKLTAAMDQLPIECGCIVYDRSVLIGPVKEGLDLTPRLREMVK